MKIAYTLYELEASHSLSAKSNALKRVGALLRVDFGLGFIGYADCHAWPELGDLTLKEQLFNLSQGKLTALTRCALDFAHLDAKARFQCRNIFEYQSLPSSHFFIPCILDCDPQCIQQVMKRGYTHVKLKMGRDIDREIERLFYFFAHTSLKIRLDFNELLTFKTFQYFLKNIQKLKDQIDFLEDPFPFNFYEWNAIQKDGWSLACDRQARKASQYPEAAHTLIVKPAVQPCEDWQKWVDQKRIVTSYLGHPLGQLAAAYVASQIDPCCSLVHGLLSHLVYRSNSFSRQLNWDGPAFALPRGEGFGFEQEFDQLDWTPLKSQILAKSTL